MNTTKHTPAPWKLEITETRGVKYYTIASETPTRSYSIASNFAPVNRIVNLVETPNVEGEANAKLIAAAPEMLEALKELAADKYLSDPINSERMARAIAAINKATH